MGRQGSGGGGGVGCGVWGAGVVWGLGVSGARGVGSEGVGVWLIGYRLASQHAGLLVCSSDFDEPLFL